MAGDLFRISIFMILLITAISWILSFNACYNFTKMTGNECKVYIYDNNYVKIDGKWIRYDLYQSMVVSENGLNSLKANNK